jgi:hypothetical protein
VIRPLKLHLRVFEIHGVTLRVVTLRPQNQVRVSTNYFHDTWHLLGGPAGAVLLGRLLWGLAFQRHAGTLVLIDGDHVAPTPFEADPPDPIILVPDAITRIDDDLLRALRLRMRRSPGSPTTIRWHTFGMPAALERDDPRPWRWIRKEPGATRERISRRAGYLVYTAPAEILRRTGLSIYSMHTGSGGDYLPFGQRDSTHWHYDGEFQLIPGFDHRVARAIIARREIIGDRPLLAGDDERVAVWNRCYYPLR